MAKRVRTIVLITDDLTGEELPEGKGQSIAYSVDGQDYEIDLSDKNAQEFQELLSPYIDASRKVKAPRSQGRRRGKAEMQVVRQWGRDNGYSVPARGRTPESLIRAYDEAHRD